MTIIEFTNDFQYVRNDWVGGFSKVEIKFIRKYAKKPILHLFSGKSKIGQIRIDINSESNATIIQDVFEYIEKNKPKINTILLDPIYCAEQRQEIWKNKYSKLGIDKKLLYIYPYDVKKTVKLYNFFEKINPERIIIKAYDRHIPKRYKILAGLNIEIGAFKPNRWIWVYERKNHILDDYYEM